MYVKAEEINEVHCTQFEHLMVPANSASELVFSFGNIGVGGSGTIH